MKQNNYSIDPEILHGFLLLNQEKGALKYSSPENKPIFATFDELLDSESFGATSRGTGTLIFGSNCWFIASYHLSFPIPDDIAKTVFIIIIIIIIYGIYIYKNLYFGLYRYARQFKK